MKRLSMLLIIAVVLTSCAKETTRTVAKPNYMPSGEVKIELPARIDRDISLYASYTTNAYKNANAYDISEILYAIEVGQIGVYQLYEDDNFTENVISIASLLTERANYFYSGDWGYQLNEFDRAVKFCYDDSNNVYVEIFENVYEGQE